MSVTNSIDLNICGSQHCDKARAQRRQARASDIRAFMAPGFRRALKEETNMQAFSPQAQQARKTISFLAALLIVIGIGAVSGTANSVPPGFNLIPTPGGIGPIPSEDFASPTNNYTFYATDIALASHGYVEEEFYMKGIANAYNAPANTPATPPTTLATIVTPNIPYKTRITVRRPVDPAKFNGTVLVEWFNVTDNFDGEYFWVQAQQD